MRTTLTLDPDVAKTLEKEMRRTGKSLKATVNDALRQGLRPSGVREKPARFVVKARPLGVRPGVDLDRINQLVDELEAFETAKKAGR